MHAAAARSAALGTLATALLAASSAFAGGDVAASVQVTRLQDQAGKVIRVTAFVVAEEQITVNGRGRLRLGGKWHRLKPKATPQELAPEAGFNLKLRPGADLAEDIAMVLNAGRRLRARLTVILSTPDGREETTSYHVRVIR
jgi:hypothetical protein